MKKLLMLFLTMMISVSLVACGGSENGEAPPAEPNKVEEQAEGESIDEFEIDMAKVKVVDVRKGTADDFEAQVPVILVTYEVTNKDAEPLSPSTVWMACVEAKQETDTTVERLETPISNFVEPEIESYFKENQADFATEMKTGATMTDVWAYTIKYPDKPVTLNFTKGVLGDELGKMVINLDELD